MGADSRRAGNRPFECALPDGRIVAGDDAGTLGAWKRIPPRRDRLAEMAPDPGNGGRNRSPRMALAAPTQVRLDDEGALDLLEFRSPGRGKYEVWKDTRPEFDTATLFRPSVGEYLRFHDDCGSPGILPDSRSARTARDRFRTSPESPETPLEPVSGKPNPGLGV